LNLSHLTLRRLTQDLQALRGARFQDASLAQPNELILDVARSDDERTTRILVSGSRSQARICITKAPFPARPDRPPWLERYILKAVIRGIRLQPDDRILVFDLDKQDRVGSRYPSQLIVEMMARDSNAILVDESGKIQGILRTQISEYRRLHPGAVFEYPRPQNRRMPADIPPSDFQHALATLDGPMDVLMKLCSGMDRHLAGELIHRANQTQSDLLAVTQAFYENPPFDESPGCVLTPSGQRTAAVAFEPTHIGPALFEPTTTISEAIERAFEDSLTGIEKRGEKKVLLKTLSRAIKTARTKRDRIAADLVKARNADELEQRGSLILSQPSSIPPGASTVELDNLFDEKAPRIRIELNPDLSASANGQAFLKRAAKARKSEPVLERRLGQTEQTIEELEGLTNQVEQISNDDEDEVERYHKKLEERRLIRPRRTKNKPGKRDPSALHPRKYRTSDGWEVWVGRNDQENDRITKSAPRNAVWFHAHGCPGSHVILRTRDQREPSPEALRDAASLAAYWSKARGAKTVPVSYTEARHVSKPRGAPAGKVTIRNEKTLFVQPREIEKWDDTE
jgi:predicted ribosome quality control (RQC) complex YloA/Tae2 family protein